MSDRRIVVTIDSKGVRLDTALSKALPDISRTQCQRLIRSGLVTINGLPVKGSQRLAGPEEIQVIIPEAESSELVPEDIPLEIVYEDQDILLIDKPAGMVVHPAVGNESGTLVNALLYYFPNLPGIGGEKRPGIVHRLDKDTSGLIVVAKTEFALKYLQAQFEERTVKKCYLALVPGHFQKREVLIDAPIGRDPNNRKKMAVIPANLNIKSRPAETRVMLRKHYDEFSLVQCYPLTGRTHQIRVHLSYFGFPILGDTLYGPRKPQLKIGRTFLHASELSFRRPKDDREVSFYSKLPDELSSLLNTLQ